VGAPLIIITNLPAADEAASAAPIMPELASASPPKD
jgi:hypothetical protein